MRPIRLYFVTSDHRTTPQHDTDVAETFLVVRSCGTTVFWVKNELAWPDQSRVYLPGSAWLVNN